MRGAAGDRTWRAASLAATALALLIAVAGTVSGRRAQPLSPSPAPPPRGQRGPAEPLAFSMAPTVSPDAPLPGEVSRRILALYDSSEEIDDTDDDGHPRRLRMSSEIAPAHRLAELPLDHLGLVVDYWDVDRGEFPSARAMSRYRGVLSWLTDNRMRHPEAYLRWLVEQARAGRRVVIMEGLGAYEDLHGRAVSRELIAQVFAVLGARFVGNESADSSAITVTRADRGMFGFEAPLPHKLDYYERFIAAPSSKVYLQIDLADEPDSASDVAWTSPAGGFVMQQVAWREDRIADRQVTRWLIDPFKFFAAAFAVEDLPRVDFTTLNGSRIFYSQIDGDGMEMLSELDYVSRCGAIVRDQILRRYDLPFSASVVVGFVAPPPLGQGSPTDVEVARSIFALDNVEPASHGFAHPLDWRDPTGASVSVQGLPGYRMNADWEIARSVEYINRELAPADKPCRLMLWTGDCNPTAEQLATAYRLGLHNLNGGDPRMDAHFPSYAHLVAPVHHVGDWVQYFTSAANDYILTNEWKPPFYRFRNVVQTFERTGAPRRIVPVDVYFHFYSARNQTALTALKEVLDWSARQELVPMFASEYIDIVRDASWARLARRSDGDWIVRKGPALRTLRFDDPTLHVDVAHSRGVIGYVQEPALHATYVHLDASPEARIRLSPTAPRTPYLERATAFTDELDLSSDQIRLRTHGAGRRAFVFAGLPPGQRWHLDGTQLTVDARGRLTVRLPAGRRAPTTIALGRVGS